MSVLEQRLSLSRGEDLVWYAAGGRCALRISVSDGETTMVVFGVFGDIGMALVVCVFRRRQWCEPDVRRVFRSWIWTVILRAGGE